VAAGAAVAFGAVVAAAEPGAVTGAAVLAARLVGMLTGAAAVVLAATLDAENTCASSSPQAARGTVRRR